MEQTAVEFIIESVMSRGLYTTEMLEEFEQAKQMENREKLECQLFIGKVSEIIGDAKTVELLKECEEAIKTN